MLRRSAVWLVVGVLSVIFTGVAGGVRGEECKVSTEATSVRRHQPSDSHAKFDRPPAPQRVRGFTNLSVYYEEVDGGRVMKIAKRPEFTFAPATGERGGTQK